MTVIVGGLLVVSLLARPSNHITEKLAYKYILPREQIHSVSSTSLDNDLIDGLFDDVMDNTRKLKSKAKQQSLKIFKLQSRLDLCNYLGVNISNENVSLVSRIFNDTKSITTDLESFFQEVRSSIDNIQHELLITDTDKMKIVAELDYIKSKQQDMIQVVTNSNTEIENLIANF